MLVACDALGAVDPSGHSEEDRRQEKDRGVVTQRFLLIALEPLVGRRPRVHGDEVGARETRAPAEALARFGDLDRGRLDV